MQSVHGTGEPGLDAIKVTNWNLANKVVTLAYFQGKMNFFGNCFPKKQSDNKRSCRTKLMRQLQKSIKKSANHVTIFCTNQSG